MQAYSVCRAGSFQPHAFAGEGHDPRRSLLFRQQVAHVFHVRLHVAEVDFQTFAERVFGLPSAPRSKRCFGAPRHGRRSRICSAGIPRAACCVCSDRIRGVWPCGRFRRAGSGDVAQFVGVDEVVAGVDVAVAARRPSVAARLAHRAGRPAARRTTGPARRRTSGRNSGPRRPRPTGRKRRTENARSLRP